METEKEPERETEDQMTCRREGHVKTEAEMGVMQPQAKECQQPLNMEDKMKGNYPRACGGNEGLPILLYGFLASRMSESSCLLF